MGEYYNTKIQIEKLVEEKRKIADEISQEIETLTEQILDCYNPLNKCAQMDGFYNLIEYEEIMNGVRNENYSL